MRIILSVAFIALTIVCYGQVAINPIPDQISGKGGSFDKVDLSQYTSDGVFWDADFLVPDSPTAKPDWQVNSASFQFQMNITAVVTSKGEVATGEAHLLAVVNNTGVVQGLIKAIQVGNEWVYFLTVYGNINGEELFFQFYDDQNKQVLKGSESFTFSSNAIIGQPDEPFTIDVATFKITLTGSDLVVGIEDETFVGTEKIVITARSLTDPNDLARYTVGFTIFDDFVPVLANIPAQTTNFDEAFTTFDLDDFTTLSDDDLVSFSFAGNQSLTVAIDENKVVTITKPNDWFGTETITFTVTDISANTFTSFQEVVFTGKQDDQAPVVSAIDDQVTGLQGVFKSIIAKPGIICYAFATRRRSSTVRTRDS